MKTIFLLACMAATLFQSKEAIAQDWNIKKSPEGVLILEGKDSVLFYQSKTKSMNGQFPRADYVHPLWGVNGEVLTEDFPKDHLHHRGIFWTWHQIYVHNEEVADAWICKNFKWNVKRADVVEQNDRSLTLEATVFWESPNVANKRGERKPFVRETTFIKVHRGQKFYRIIDFEIRLAALEKGVAIGGSDNEKGYGGFCLRMPMPDDLRFISNTGEIIPQTMQVKAGPWMDIVGSIGKFHGKAGILIIVHKDNPPPVDKWILRRKGSMQNPVFPGRALYHLSKDDIVLRYRLVVHEGGLNVEQINDLFKSYNRAQ